MTEVDAGPRMTETSVQEPAVEIDESWILSTRQPHEEHLYLANGYLGTSLDFTGGMLFESGPAPCYVRGVYTADEPERIDRLAVLPAWNRFRYGHPATIELYDRRLDLRHGILRTELRLREERGEVRLVGEILMSRADRHQATVHLLVEPSFDGEIELLAGLEALLGGDAQVESVSAHEGALLLRSRIGPYGLGVCQALRFEHSGASVEVCTRENSATAILTFDGHAGEILEATQLSRVATTLEAPDPQGLVQGDYGSYQRIRALHVEAWDALWQTDIEVDGDPEVQQFARAALFYLWSTVREDDEWSIAPMGLSGNFYNGHIFWDAELWMYPSLLVTQPALGKSCTAYRERTLGPARERAAQSGHSGAQFPWEGAFTGEEMTPPWAETRDFQIHVTADVAIGQWWYYLATGDRAWLRDHGFPVIRACAEYWVSRVERKVEADRYEISNVVCADEYAEHVDNDAFTNAAVRQALQIAVRAAELLNVPAPREWSDIAGKIYIPYDAENQRHLEFEGYDGRVTKQADVELLSYPLEYVADPQQIERDLDYYGTVIDPHGPAMSFSVYSILSAQLGRSQDAYEYLRKSFIPNTRQPFWSFSETPTNNEYFFCTGIGGALQALLFGFSGLRWREDHIVLGPSLPPHWSALRLRGLFVQGARTDIELEPGRTVVRRHLSEGVVSVDVDLHTAAVAFAWTGEAEQLRVEMIDHEGRRLQLMEAERAGRMPFPLDGAPGARLRLCSEAGTALLDLVLRTPGMYAVHGP
jgi:trehalose/maltose hydrolase-like predicted phosphorylase